MFFTYPFIVYDAADVKDFRCQMSTATVPLVYVCYGAIVISINYAMVVDHLLCLGMFDLYELCCGSMFKLKF